MRKKLMWTSVAALGVAALVAAGVLVAQDGERVRACDLCAPPSLPTSIPPVGKGPMAIVDGPEAVSILQFDDGSCESGLGASTAVTSYVEFDVPTQCVQGGLDVIGITSRMNTFNAQNFAWAQGSVSAPMIGQFSSVAITDFVGQGPCPSNFVETRTFGPGAAVITGTSNFWAGLFNTGFVGRDSNGPPAGRIWINCPICGMTQYGPATLSGLGLGGNWMIRVTVEDQNCVPVELMNFEVS
jgi:hypothetical protein